MMRYFGEDLMRNMMIAGVAGAGLLAGCNSVTVNDVTVKDMPTGYLCQFLNPDTWISTSAERTSIFKELKDRDADCVLPTGTSKKNF